jgi:hypothetical protein
MTPPCISNVLFVETVVMVALVVVVSHVMNQELDF